MPYHPSFISINHSTQFNRYVNVGRLKHYFNVSNSYVVNKLFIVLFPWRHRPWSRQQQLMSSSGQGPLFLPPREDINSPDLYIPRMFKSWLAPMLDLGL